MRRPGGAVDDFASGISQPVDLQVAADGSLYYLARGTGSTTGVVSRIAYVLLPSAGELPSGAYRWIVLVDEDTDGTPDGDVSDFVVTVIG